MIQWFVPHLSVIVGMLLAAAAIAHMLQQRRSPSSIAAWLLVMVLLPYVGVPLYILFGGRKMARLAGRKEDVRLKEHHMIPLADASPIDRALRGHGIPAATTSNRLDFCLTGERAYESLVSLIESAEKSIYISTYVFDADEVGKDIMARLIKKAAGGVRVRLLLDGVGTLQTGSAFYDSLTVAGGRYSYFMPVLHRPLRGRTNLRNHRKIALADERLLMAGGANIAAEYLGPVSWEKRWRELTFTAEGPVVKSFVELFASDWHFASGELLPLTEDTGEDFLPDSCRQAILQVVPSGPDLHHDGLYEAILSAIFTAEKRIWIVTPYFVPDDALSQSLAIACRRGVEVRIVIPRRSNHPLADVVRGYYLRDLEKDGAVIMLHNGPMMHAKAMLVDDRLAVVGSANMDLRSLLINYEVAVFVYSAAEIGELEVWAKDLFRETVSGYPAAGRLRNLTEGIARIVAPLV